MYNCIKLIPYKIGSQSCKNLQEALKQLINIPVWRIKKEEFLSPQRRHLIRDEDLTIFWGCPSSVASNKLKFFEACKDIDGINVPDWTTSKETAQQWIDDGKVVFGRQKLTSHSGNGIILFENETITEDKLCPLYVKYKKKTHEYRVHVFNGKVIDITQKRKRVGMQTNARIRNLDNGWVFCREDLDIDNKNELTKQAILACSVCKLDFGAVDIIWNKQEKKYYVLEVNTAPGLEGQTTTKYAQAIKDFMELAND